MNFGYQDWGAGLANAVSQAQEAERLGYDSVWTAEAYGTDCVTPLTWLLAHTERIRGGTAIMQMPARTPAMTAMTAATLDLMSSGRFLLGLGLFLAVLSVPIPYGVSFKLVTISGLLLLPVAAWAFGRLSGLPFPGPPMLAIASLFVIYNREPTLNGRVHG